MYIRKEAQAMKKEKADKMVEQLKLIITYHNNWISRQKDLKTAAGQFDKAVQDLCTMIQQEVKDDN